MSLYNIKSIISQRKRLGLLFSRFNIAAPYPLFLLTHIILSCSRKCKWCYQTDDEFYSSRNAMQMDISAFRNILSSFKFFKPHIHLFGGEPLSHPDFPLFLDCCRMYGYKPTLTTNGDYLDKYSDIIIRSSLSQLNLSINGIMNHSGKLESCFENKIKEFLMMNKKRKIVNINYVIEQNSYNRIEELLLHFNDNYKKGDFAYFVIQHLMPNKASGQQSNLKNIDSKILSGILMRIKKIKLKFNLLFLPEIRIKDIGNYYNLKNSPLGNRCFIPWLGLAIYPDLTVTPGAGILGCNFVLGNLNRDSIWDIWRSKNLHDFRKNAAINLSNICHGCCHKFYYG